MRNITLAIAGAVVLSLVPGCQQKPDAPETASTAVASAPPAPAPAQPPESMTSATPAKQTAPAAAAAKPGSSAKSSKPSSSKKDGIVTTSSGLMYKDEKPGSGKVAKSGDTVTVNYTGTLENGTKFDSSYDHGQPFTFHLGGGEVIKGWDEGVAGMKVGGKRKLVIPSELGYGPAGRPPKIPPAATLIFEVELMNIG